MKRIERLTALISFLQSKKFISMEQLMERFPFSERTLYRDLNSLHEIGVPVSFEKNKGYFIVDTHFLPPVSFSEEEATSLIMAGVLMRRYSDKKTNDHFGSAIEKVKNVLNSSMKGNIEFFESNIKTASSNYDIRDKNYLFIMQNAIIGKRIIQIKYLDRKNNSTIREIEPIGISFYSNQWHVVGYCLLRKDYRDFIIASIQELADTQKKFTIEEHLTLDQYIQKIMS